MVNERFSLTIGKGAMTLKVCPPELMRGACAAPERVRKEMSL